MCAGESEIRGLFRSHTQQSAVADLHDHCISSSNSSGYSPDVGVVSGVLRQGDAPGHGGCGSRDGKVPQTRLHPAQHLSRNRMQVNHH